MEWSGMLSQEVKVFKFKKRKNINHTMKLKLIID
jgi:hypothetical protein